MIPPLHLRLSTAEKTQLAGLSLAETLYKYPTTIFLTGEVGAGKTTFMQGFAEALGITEPLTSPTYALEQRYETRKGAPLFHLDLYRLKEQDAAILVQSTEEQHAIRCIEWSDRLPKNMQDTYAIHLHFEEDGDGRLLTVHWNDGSLPTDAQIDQWRSTVLLPAHIILHCEAVARIAGLCADLLIERGHIIRKDAVVAAGRLHDLLRFVDFHGATAAPEHFVETDRAQKIWNEWRTKYAQQKHETACADFLLEQGFPLVSAIVRTHGLRSPLPPMDTIEQKILFYADKRCMIDRSVTVDERFADFQVRYTHGQKSQDQDVWYGFTKQIEQELFPDGPPSFS